MYFTDLRISSDISRIC